MTTKRVHTTDDYDLYGGRGNNGERNIATAANNHEIGQEGWLGNPYKLNDYDRDQAIELYERDLTWLIEEKSWFREALKSLYGKRIACSCPSHMDCHVDVLVRKVNALYWKEYDEN